VSVMLSLELAVNNISVALFADRKPPSLRRALFSGVCVVTKKASHSIHGPGQPGDAWRLRRHLHGENACTIGCKRKVINPKWTMFFVAVVVDGTLGIIQDKYPRRFLLPQQLHSIPLA
jgi:hypothetical protein